MRIETSIENVTSDCSIDDMSIYPLSKKFIKHQVPSTPVEDYDDECFIVFTLSNSNILTSLLRFIPKPNQENTPFGFINATLVPQNLFTPKREKLQDPI